MTWITESLHTVTMNHGALKTIPERVKYARKEAGYTSQTKMAEAMGITREAYAWYETTRDITTEHLPKFCDLTGFSVKWIVTGEEDIDDEISNLLKDLPSDEKNAMLAYLRARFSKEDAGKTELLPADI